MVTKLIVSIVGLVALLGQTVLAQGVQSNTTDNQFTYPPPGNDGNQQNNQENLVFTTGSEMELKWATNYASLNLALLHQGENGSVANTYLNNVTTTTFFRWNVEIPDVFDQSKGSIYYFIVQQQKNGKQADYFFTENFNITQGSAPSPSSTPTSGTPTSSTPSATGEPQNNYPSTSNGPAASSNGISKGAQAGIGVGVAVGVIGLVVGGVGFWYARRSKGSQAAAAPAATNEKNYPEGQWQNPQYYQQSQYGQYGQQANSFGQPTFYEPQEMGAYKAPQELPSTGKRHELSDHIPK